MQRMTCKAALLVGALTAGALTLTLNATAQQKSLLQKAHAQSADVAITFDAEHSRVARPNGNGFWLKGGSADAAATFWKGLGLAANFTGERTDNAANGVALSKFAYMFGPRYTLDTAKYTDRYLDKHDMRLFGEALFGGVHGFDSIFPAASGVSSSANAFSMQLGGGVDVALAEGFSVRALEVDYVRTSLPNAGSNTQNDLRLAFGVSYRFGK
ncbi:MAG TPA: hypothetical protein VNU94_01805 [Acidobacteriaceae bacterium]|jgi:outer membrane immunogenic protein|nr:hypothetical protein [Acidobacteriaceae bacterium]